MISAPLDRFSTEQQEAFVKACREDPVFFFKYVLGVEPWSKQEEILYAIRDHNRVTVRSGHKVSKSNTIAGAALWWATTQGEGARAAITSASFHQVKKIVWKEIRSMYRKSKIPIGGKLYRDPASGLEFPNGNEIFGFSTDEPENAAGISAPKLIYFIDEASGVPDAVFEAIEGNRAADAKIVMFSNPTRMVGVFYDSHNTKARFWKNIHISSEDSPNVTGERRIPGLATEKWINEKRDEWGEDSPEFQVRIKGNFPGIGEDSVIGLARVEEARMGYENTPSEGPLRVGVDCARFGDDETVISVVRGFKAYPVMTARNADGTAVAAKVCEAVEKYRRPTDAEIEVKVDEIGLGASPIDALKASNWASKLGITVKGVHVQKKARNSDEYHDLRSELCFDLADWIDSGGKIPDDDKLREELLSATYGFDKQGRRKVASKDDERKLIGRSPDRRNALELAIHNAKPTQTIGGAYVRL